MGGFKRFCLFVIGVAGLLAMAALLTPWFGPWTETATKLMFIYQYGVAVQVLCVIAGIGCLVAIIVALTARKVDAVIVSSQGGQVTVTCSAIKSQAVHIIEDDGECLVDRIRVKARPRGNIDFSIRLRPLHVVDIMQKGAQLNQALVNGLAVLVGDRVGKIDLQFLDAASNEAAPAAAAPQSSLAEVTLNPAEYTSHFEPVDPAYAYQPASKEVQ